MADNCWPVSISRGYCWGSPVLACQTGGAVQTESHLRASRDMSCLFDSGNKAKLHKEGCFGPQSTHNVSKWNMCQPGRNIAVAQWRPRAPLTASNALSLSAWPHGRARWFAGRAGRLHFQVEWWHWDFFHIERWNNSTSVSVMHFYTLLLQPVLSKDPSCCQDADSN